MGVLKYIFCFAIICSSLICFGQAEELDKYFEKKRQKAGLIGLQVAFLSEDGNTWQGQYGVKEMNTTDSVDADTRFMIASCSKPITAVAILKLVDQGKLSLDDPVNKHLPFEINNPNHPNTVITIRMLLSHVSSLADNWDILSPNYTLPEGGDPAIPLDEYVKGYFTPDGAYYDPEKNFLKSAPTTEFAYCNMGYATAGYIVQLVSGMPFEVFCKKEIFQPLGMEAYWFLRDIPDDNIAFAHDMPWKKSDFDSPKVLPHYGYPDYPDGQIRTTAADYIKFLKMLVNNGKVGNDQFLSPDLIDEFVKIQYPETAKHQAIAWNYNEFDNFVYYLLMPRLPSHTGADPGVATAVSFDMENKRAAVVFTNSPPTKFGQQKIFYQEMMKKLLKQ